MTKNKLSTPDWIKEGYDSPAEYEKAKGKTEEKKTDTQGRTPKDFNQKSLQGAKTFKIRKCPECGSFDVVVVTEKDAVGLWRCGKCGWEGKNVGWEEMTEEEFMKYTDEIAPKGVPSIEEDINIKGREEIA
ncbi:MAG: hypothetical protein ABIA78_02635 [archaeon]